MRQITMDVTMLQYINCMQKLLKKKKKKKDLGNNLHKGHLFLM